MCQKVVFHIDEMQKWKLLLHNAKNLLSSYADPASETAVEVLANGEAVQAYVFGFDNSLESHMQALSDSGVAFVACNNALAGYRISKEQLISFVIIVPAGVRELVDKQTDGFAYIKP